MFKKKSDRYAGSRHHLAQSGHALLFLTMSAEGSMACIMGLGQCHTHCCLCTDPAQDLLQKHLSQTCFVSSLLAFNPSSSSFPSGLSLCASFSVFSGNSIVCNLPLDPSVSFKFGFMLVLVFVIEYISDFDLKAPRLAGHLTSGAQV